MKIKLLLLVFCSVSSTVKHSAELCYTTSAGFSHLPEFMTSLLVDGVQVGYCDNRRIKAKREAAKKILMDEPRFLDEYRQQCFHTLPDYFKPKLYSIMQHRNLSGGEHLLQGIQGCKWDETRGHATGSVHLCYDGEDVLSLDLNRLTWVAKTPQAVIAKQVFDANREMTTAAAFFARFICPELLKKYLKYDNLTLLKAVPPSVSLLRQSPSSPVSCHATGFYPDRAQMFWRKDGEEIHEDVDQGEILPNQDGTFQMRVDLNISADEDWSRYQCVFQLSGVDDVITKLEKSVITSNYGKTVTGELPVAAVVGVSVSLLLLAVAITGLMWRRRNGFRPAKTSDANDIIPHPGPGH